MKGYNLMSAYRCGNSCGEDMEYVGGVDWECPICGEIRSFGESEDHG